MCIVGGRQNLHAARHRGTNDDRGAVDVSIEMLAGLVAVLFTLMLVFEAASYWHARNVFDDAAAEGARVAATYDHSCADGIAVARRMVDRHAGRWAASVSVTCTEGALVVMTVSGRTPGVGAMLGFRARVVETVPKER